MMGKKKTAMKRGGKVVKKRGGGPVKKMAKGGISAGIAKFKGKNGAKKCVVVVLL